MMMKMANIVWKLKLIFILALSSKSGEELIAGIKSLHSMIVAVGHRKGAIWKTTNTNWIVEFTIGSTRLSSSNHLDELAFIIIYRPYLQLVIVVITNQEMIDRRLNAKADRKHEFSNTGTI